MHSRQTSLSASVQVAPSSPPGRLAHAWQRLRAWFSAYEADEALSATFRARQLQAMLQLTPAAMAANVINAIVIGVTLAGKLAAAYLLAWVAAVCLLSGLGLRGWWRTQARPPRQTASRRAIRHAMFHAGLLGATWAVLPAVAYSRLGSDEQYFVGVVLTAMICAGGFALASVPAAATVWVVVLGAGSSLALWRDGSDVSIGMALLLFNYCAVVIYSIWTSAKSFGVRLLAEARADQQHEVIGLLLRDFEDHASDLLWELDATGRLQHVSPRLAGALGAPAPWLQRLPALRFLGHAVPADPESHAAWAALLQRLSEGAAFREQLVALAHEGKPTWWSLSARPLLDRHGRVAGWRGVAANVTDRQQAHQRLIWMAHNDALTGLCNRAHFRDLLSTALRSAAARPASAQGLAVVLFDMNGFKQINDTLGHAAGDALLCLFGERLREVVHGTDTVARLGGDEFALLVHGADEARVQLLLQRLFAALDRPGEVEGKMLLLRASAGVALAPRDGADVDTLLGHADLALYAAKRDSGSRWRFFEPYMHERHHRHVRLAQDLRGAADRGELHLEYQPQVDATSGRVYGVEALLRWRHPVHGAVSPAEFVPIAETAGLMPQLGEWALVQACHQARLWPQALKVSINVSATQLGDRDFPARVQAAVKGLEPGRIELEVTESALIADPDAVVQTFRQLREHGVRIALDDFGTGYAALGYLCRFRFDTLKIDRSFVTDLAANAESRAIVDTILAMAKALRMATVAEGVEASEQASMLCERSCAALQGFLISRPLAPERVPAFLDDWDPAAFQASCQHEVSPREVAMA